MLQNKRITIFAGHYGSGKTTIALNYAVWLKATCEDVVICDLDIVNPYFRTLDGLSFMEANDVKLISSEYANTNVELPSIPPQAQSVFDDRSITAVIDLGGDERGALALGRYSEYIVSENDYEMLLVMNMYRPLTQDRESLAIIKEEIERAACVKFTGLVNNSNLGAATTIKDINKSVGFAKDMADFLGLPLKMTTVDSSLSVGDIITTELLPEIFPVKRFKKDIWAI